ncbi:hypothetical protein Taro_022701 [Colocasia esculenta]|uniref:Uncharacterized protein n=1 Tax=Colocasia esculenta TaxID=4460 RepID=A0A843VF82_COLES|nr:hypothetical protein [Colocasia esculenta]
MLGQSSYTVSIEGDFFALNCCISLEGKLSDALWGTRVKGKHTKRGPCLKAGKRVRKEEHKVFRSTS